jgi:hypothetical protein
MKRFFLCFILLFQIGVLLAQKQPCLDSKRSKYTTGPNSKTSPIFPGCELFKENNDSLNTCFGRTLGQLIAEKLDKNSGGEILAGSTIYQNKISVHVEPNGKMNYKLIKPLNTFFENKLVQKLTEISEEIKVIPATYEGNFCAPFIYTLPLAIELSEDEISSQ